MARASKKQPAATAEDVFEPGENETPPAPPYAGAVVSGDPVAAAPVEAGGAPPYAGAETIGAPDPTVGVNDDPEDDEDDEMDDDEDDEGDLPPPPVKKKYRCRDPRVHLGHYYKLNDTACFYEGQQPSGFELVK